MQLHLSLNAVVVNASSTGTMKGVVILRHRSIKVIAASFERRKPSIRTKVTRPVGETAS